MFIPNCSMGIKANLLPVIVSGNQQYTPTKHRGNIQGNIVKYIPSAQVGEQNAVNVLGKYYHKTIDASDGAITVSVPPSITITFSNRYEESPNTTAVFYYYN